MVICILIVQNVGGDDRFELEVPDRVENKGGILKGAK